MASPDRIAYFNGRFVPEREVLVPFRDRGFKYGDAVFDTTRTFGHRVFKLREHVERLYRSLRYLRIDSGVTPEAMIDITEEVLRRNLPLLEPDEDYWVTQRVSRGIEAVYRNVWPQEGATVIVECVPLPLRERATLYRSLRYLRIDPGLTSEAMIGITEEVLRRNLPLLEPDEDYWVTQRVSRGIEAAYRNVWPQEGATVIVECVPLPLRERATLYRDGIRVMTPSVRRTPPQALSPRVKTHNYLNMIAGDLEVRAQDPGAWAILLDTAGNLAEGLGSNIFLVQDGALATPREQVVLSGISRETVIDLAREAGIPLVEKDLDLYDAYNADEVFLTSTSLCICPVASVNGARIGAAVPGPLTRQLTEAYCRFVDFDFVGQYLKRLG